MQLCHALAEIMDHSKITEVDFYFATEIFKHI